MSEQDRLQVMHGAKDAVTHSPDNPQKVIGSSATSAEDDAAEAVKKRRSKLKKTGSRGGFAGLLKELNNAKAEETVTKALPVASGPREVVRFNDGLDQAAIIKTLKAGPTAAQTPTDGAMLKALAPAFDKAAKTLGVTNPLLKSDAPVGSTSLEATYNSDSATLTGGDALRKQSLPKKIFVKMEPAPLTGDEITKAASAALTAGAITGAEAKTIATHVALNGGKHCDPDLLKKIGSHVK